MRPARAVHVLWGDPLGFCLARSSKLLWVLEDRLHCFSIRLDGAEATPSGRVDSPWAPAPVPVRCARRTRATWSTKQTVNGECFFFSIITSVREVKRQSREERCGAAALCVVVLKKTHFEFSVYMLNYFEEQASRKSLTWSHVWIF